MRTIIAGSRSLGYPEICKAMAQCGWIPTVVVSGGATGSDKAGERWANERGIPVVVYPANWQRFGRSAGYVRNSVMADNADALVLSWDGVSKGSRNMAETARRKGLKIYLFNVEAMQ